MTSDHRGTRARRRWAFMALAAVLLLAACGGDEEPTGAAETGSEAATGTEADTGTETVGGECGTVPEVTPNDPDGLLAQLPEDLQAA